MPVVGSSHTKMAHYLQKNNITLKTYMNEYIPLVGALNVDIENWLENLWEIKNRHFS